jgi:hypothetical protein
MAYDENLADRIRELIAGEADLTKQKMFGGLTFLIGGNMAVEDVPTAVELRRRSRC